MIADAAPTSTAPRQIRSTRCEHLAETDTETVYNIHVENHHNYYVVVGGTPVLVHNAKHAGPHGTFEPSPKHGATQRGNAAPEPTNGQGALDRSHQIKPTTTRRVAVDKDDEEFVVFDETYNDSQILHGHVRSWSSPDPDQPGLTQAMQNALTKAGEVTRKGKIKE